MWTHLKRKPSWVSDLQNDLSVLRFETGWVADWYLFLRSPWQSSLLPTSSWVILHYHWKKLLLSWEFKHLEISLVIVPSWADHELHPYRLQQNHPSPAEPLLLGPWTIQWTHLRVHLDSLKRKQKEWRTQATRAALAIKKRCQHSLKAWSLQVLNFVTISAHPIQQRFQTSM